MTDTEHDNSPLEDKPSELLSILSENALMVLKKELYKVALRLEES